MRRGFVLLAILLALVLSLWECNALRVYPSKVEVTMLQGSAHTITFHVVPASSVDSIEVRYSAGYISGLVYNTTFDPKKGVILLRLLALKPGLYNLNLIVREKINVTVAKGVVAKPALSVPVVVVVPGARILDYYLRVDPVTGETSLCFRVAVFHSKSFPVDNLVIEAFVDEKRVFRVNASIAGISAFSRCIMLGTYEQQSTHTVILTIRTRYSIDNIVSMFRVGRVSAKLSLSASTPSMVVGFFGARFSAIIRAVVEFNTTRCNLYLVGSSSGTRIEKFSVFTNQRVGVTRVNETILRVDVILPPSLLQPLRVVPVEYAGILQCLGVQKSIEEHGSVTTLVVDAGSITVYVGCAATATALYMLYKRRRRRLTP